MKYSVTILALAAAASAQSIGACDGKAQACIETAMEEAGVCEDPKDWACGCENMDAVQSKATTCVIEACGGASGALEVIEEVKEICANLPEDGDDEEPTDAEPTDAEPTDAEPTDAEPTDAEPTDAEPTDAEPTDAEPTGEEPQPSGEEPAPTDDCEDDDEEPTESGEEGAEPTGEEPEEPQPSGGAEEPEEPETSAPPTAGAGMLAPIGSLVVGLFAFAL